MEPTGRANARPMIGSAKFGTGTNAVMAGLVPAIHVLLSSPSKKDVDARQRRQVYALCAGQAAMAGHDEL